MPKEWQTEKNLLKILEIDGYVIRFIEKPTLGVQWEAIKQNGRAIQFIEEPTLEMQLEAVKQEGQAIQYIKNPTVEVQLEAVKQDVNELLLLLKIRLRKFSHIYKKNIKSYLAPQRGAFSMSKLKRKTHIKDVNID